MSRDAPPGTKVYVGNLEPDTQESALNDEFSKFGRVAACWIARNPSGFAFVQFEDARDAEDAVRELNGKNGWRVEVARAPRSRDAAPGGGRCYICNEPGHFARECPRSGGGGGGGRGYGGDRGGYGDRDRAYGDRDRGYGDRGYGGDRGHGDRDRGYGGDRDRAYGGDRDRGYDRDDRRSDRYDDRNRDYDRREERRERSPVPERRRERSPPVNDRAPRRGSPEY